MDVLKNAERQGFYGVEAIVCSLAMRETLRQAQRAARSSAAVLITGETGSGKEIIARAIHSYSLRCAKPWVDVNCAALPDHLMESELFGYEKGAFSGADSTKPGMFEMADGGTLFLDEIGELEPRMQVKLLRVLDGGPYYRLGGVRKVSVDVRIVAATNCDLEASTHNGRFRHDLFHRLDQIHIRVPPLRERVDAIAPLAEHFLQRFDPSLHFTNRALDLLCHFDWPGNVRQLRNVVTKAAAAAEGDTIEVGDLPEPLQSARRPIQSQTPEPSGLNLDAMERRMIEQAIAQTGDPEEAANRLGISRRTLSRKMRAYQMEELASA
jgi:DNA-binding NtrC family response regulator